jgi:hypothetical protein
LNTGANADAGLTFFRHSDIPAFTYKGIYFSTTGSMDVRMFSFPESTFKVCVDLWVYTLPPPAGCERAGVFIFTVNSVDMGVYRQCGLCGGSLTTASRGGRECVSLSLVNKVTMRVYLFPLPAVWT